MLNSQGNKIFEKAFICLLEMFKQWTNFSNNPYSPKFAIFWYLYVRYILYTILNALANTKKKDKTYPTFDLCYTCTVVKYTRDLQTGRIGKRFFQCANMSTELGKTNCNCAVKFCSQNNCTIVYKKYQQKTTRVSRVFMCVARTSSVRMYIFKRTTNARKHTRALWKLIKSL